MTQDGYAQEYTPSAVSTSWRELLNVPPAAVVDGPSRVRVGAYDCVAEVRVRTWVQGIPDDYTAIAAPGEPVEVPVTPYGCVVYVRPLYFTPYQHDEAGVPSTTAATSTTRRVRAVYLPGRLMPRPDRVASYQNNAIPGNFGGWATGAIVTLSWPVGPPGLYRLDRLECVRVQAGAANVTNLSAIAATVRYDYGALAQIVYNTAAGGAGAGIRAPNSTFTAFGGTHPRQGYSFDGWMTVRIAADAQPAADEVYALQAVHTLVKVSAPRQAWAVVP